MAVTSSGKRVGENQRLVDGKSTALAAVVSNETNTRTRNKTQIARTVLPFWGITEQRLFACPIRQS